MHYLQAIVLGVIQGLGEFLPISSSAHLILAPWLFKWEDPGLAFDVALHFGTLIAIVIYFFKDWIVIAGAGLGQEKLVGRYFDITYPRKMLWLLVAATIPGAIAGYFLEHYAESTFRNPLLIAVTLSVVGFILYWADKRLRPLKDLQHISWRESIIIGLSQALAIVPGISRSGSTITAGLLLGVDRVSAARFSFLMSTPIIFGAVVLKMKAFFAASPGLPEFAGIISAAVSGYLAIAVLIRFVEKVSYKVFFWYRLGLALFVAAIWLVRG